MLTTNELELSYNGDRLDEVLEILDDLHTAASENTLSSYTTLNKHELVAMLREVIYTAQEAITEIENGKQRPAEAKPANVVPFVIKEPMQERHA